MVWLWSPTSTMHFRRQSGVTRLFKPVSCPFTIIGKQSVEHCMRKQTLEFKFLLTTYDYDKCYCISVLLLSLRSKSMHGELSGKIQTLVVRIHSCYTWIRKHTICKQSIVFNQATLSPYTKFCISNLISKETASPATVLCRFKVKQEIADEFSKRSSTIRLLLATDAFGMGIDVPDIQRIVHVGVPSSLESSTCTKCY